MGVVVEGVSLELEVPLDGVDSEEVVVGARLSSLDFLAAALLATIAIKTIKNIPPTIDNVILFTLRLRCLFVLLELGS